MPVVSGHRHPVWREDILEALRLDFAPPDLNNAALVKSVVGLSAVSLAVSRHPEVLNRDFPDNRRIEGEVVSSPLRRLLARLLNAVGFVGRTPIGNRLS